MDNITRISRSALYEQVWTEPMLKLSKRYGLSDVGLAKICRKNEIPRPGLGYWAKKQSGKKIKQTPLPRKDADKIIEIRPNPFYAHNPELREIVINEAFLVKQQKETILVSETPSILAPGLELRKLNQKKYRRKRSK